MARASWQDTWKPPPPPSDVCPRYAGAVEGGKREGFFPLPEGCWFDPSVALSFHVGKLKKILSL